MTARAMRDLGDIALRVACSYVGLLLAALALGQGHRVSPYGWLGAVIGLPAAYALRRAGQQEVDALDATERR